MKISPHAEQRAQERGMPPYILRKAIYAAAVRSDGCYITRYGSLVVRDNTVVTVLASDMPTPADLYVYEVK